jgi:hypothetical protein
MTLGSVLVLDVLPQSLAVIRSLSRAGYHIVLGRHQQRRKTEAEFSRHCHEVWLHPGFDDPAFPESLSTFLDGRPDIQTIFPVGESSGSALLGIPSICSRHIDVAMASRDLFSACIDKAEANELARDAGLTVPASRVAHDLTTLREAAQTVGYPLIVKSVRTEARLHDRKAFLVESPGEFDSVFPAWPAGHRDLLVQAYIAGPMESADFVAMRGVLVGYCEVEAVRTDMPDGTGFAVDFKSIPPTPHVLNAIQAFVSHHRYSGPGLMQFIRSEASGELYFIENNPRLSAGIAHTIWCGQDCPLLAVQAISRGAQDRLAAFCRDDEPYRYHVRAHWLLRDIEGLLAHRNELTRTEILLWLRQTVRSFLAANCHIMWQWRDPLPSLHIYARFAKRVLSGLLRSPGRPS